MALRIWCDSKYFPPETHGRVTATVMAVLDVRGVTLEQVRDVQANVDRASDFPQEDDELAEGSPDWADAWFDAIAVAEADLGIERTPLGAMLVLEETDERFGPQMPGRTLH
jgi:hypothetical protein